MAEYAQNAVSRVIFPWQAEPSDPGRTVRRRRVRAVVQTVIMLIVAGLCFFRFEAWHAGLVLSGFAVLVLVSGLWIPAVFALFERLGRGAAVVVGVVLTWSLLVPFFYLFFTPARLWLGLRRKDPLQRRFPSDADTYWVPHRAPRSGAASYGKQY